MIGAKIKMMGDEPVIECLPCPQCGEPTVIKIDDYDLERFKAMSKGMLVGQAFSHWSVQERELLMTGLHAQCWDAYMGPEPDDE